MKTRLPPVCPYGAAAERQRKLDNLGKSEISKRQCGFFRENALPFFANNRFFNAKTLAIPGKTRYNSPREKLVMKIEYRQTARAGPRGRAHTEWGEIPREWVTVKPPGGSRCGSVRYVGLSATAPAYTGTAIC